MSVKKVKAGFTLTPGAIVKLEKASNDTGLDKSQVIEMMIRNYIENFVRTHNKT